MRILYIEDNFDNRMLVQRILMAEDFDVEGVEDPEIGIQRALEEPPDCILVDINMPKISGFDVAQQLREAPQLAQTPIIALTANATKDILAKTLEAGCDGYITKPVDVDKLPTQIMNYIARRRQAR
jgi:two-component system, cell cycle response regulator DivK